MLEDEIHESWHVPLANFFGSPEEEALDALLQEDDGNYYPRRDKIFAAFEATPFDSVRVVIIGQEPYRDDNATGIAFFADGNETGSLTNIYTAMRRDGIGDANLTNACLKRWAEEEGVLLLNSVLTFCNYGNGDNQHTSEYWEKFMSLVLTALVSHERMLQFMLWGQEAQKLKKYINGRSYHIHVAPHPTPRPLYAEEFRNCRHFSAVNNILTARGEDPINWFPPEED